MPDFLVTPPLFKPDLVETPSAEHITMLDQLARQPGGAPLPLSKELPGDTRGVRLQITAIQVVEGVQGLLGRPGGVYVVSSVIDGFRGQPITFQGKVYQGIRNGDLLPLGRGHERTAVFTVYNRERRMPRVLSFSLLVIKSNQGLRDIGRVLTQTTHDDRFQKLSDVVGETLSGANPAFSVVWQAADEAIALVGDYLAAKPDEQLGYYQANYTNLFDDLGRGKHPPDQPTMPVGKIRLCYEIDVV